MDRRANPVADIVLAVVVLLFAAAVYWQTLGLPPPRYEPLGSARLPQVLCVMMGVFALIILARGVAALRRRRIEAEPPAPALPYRKRPMLAAGIYLLTAAFVAVMDFRLLGFTWAGLIFVFAAGLLLSDFDRRQAPWLAGFAVILAFGSYTIFTRLFYIDLPS